MFSKLLKQNGPMIVMAFAFIAYNYRKGGTELVIEGFKRGGGMIVAWAPLLILMFVLTGQANALASRHLAELKTWVTGGKGIFGAVFAGIITPGNLTAAPIIRELWQQGLSKTALLVYYVSACLLNFQIIMFRAPMLGKEATIGTTIVGAVLALLFALGAVLFTRFAP